MSGILTGSLRVDGLEGFGKVLSFQMEELPGNHSTAELKGYVAETADCIGWQMQGRIITVHTEGEGRPIYSGMVRTAYIEEENGLQSISLKLASGTVCMDLVKKDHSYQDTGMSYGALIGQEPALFIRPIWMTYRWRRRASSTRRPTGRFYSAWQAISVCRCIRKPPGAVRGFMSASPRTGRRRNWNGRNIRQ